MSPRALDPAIRRAVTEAAIRILGTEGRSALTTRRLAREANTSTTAVYTYFGSMDDVHRHVRRQAIGALLAALDVVGITDDPVADLARAAAVQVDQGHLHPAMYRIMFVDQPPDDTADPAAAVFERFADLVERCIRAGRFRPDEPHHPARGRRPGRGGRRPRGPHPRARARVRASHRHPKAKGGTHLAGGPGRRRSTRLRRALRPVRLPAPGPDPRMSTSIFVTGNAASRRM